MSETQEERQEQQLIGDIIRQAREKKNVSVKIVAQHTKISSTNLEALEANDLASLPNKAYVKGYVKSCAKLLGLNEEQCLDILQSNYDSIEKPIRVKQQKQEEKVKQERENNELIFKMAGVIIVVIVVVVLLTRQDSNSDQQESKIVQETQTEQVEEVENITPVVLSDTTPLRPETTPTVIVTPEVVATPEPTPVATATPQVVKKDEKKEEEEENEEVTLRPIRGSLYGFDTEMSQDQINEWLPSNYRVSPSEGKQSVFINATDGDTWLTYQEDGGDIKKFVLKQGQKLLLNGEEVLLFLGNYRVTKIFLNNKPLAISSRSGVKSLVFPQENASEHFYPLFIYNDDGSVMNSKTYNANKSN